MRIEAPFYRFAAAGRRAAGAAGGGALRRAVKAELAQPLSIVHQAASCMVKMIFIRGKILFIFEQ
jgi:hypothetical protein